MRELCAVSLRACSASGPSWESLPCLPGQSTLLATLYKVLFRASKACRDWVLHTANRATITLAFLSLCSPAERQSQLAGAVRALSIRAAAPQASITPARSTALRVVLGDSQDMALQQMGVILDAVAEAGVGGIVTELQVSLQRPTMTKETADTVAETVAMLHRVAAVFPSLTTLSLDGWRFNAFPQLPRLRELRIVACRITEPSCVLANTPQLTHLHVTKVAQFGMGAAFWQALFASHVITQWRQSRQCATISYGGAGGASAAAGGAIRTNLNGSAAPSIGSSTTTTAADTPLPLTHFHTDEPLSTALCGILLAYAPALTHLSVAALNVTKSHADRQWALRCLHFSSHVPVQATALTSLPTGNYSVTTAAGAHVRAFVGDTQVGTKPWLGPCYRQNEATGSGTNVLVVLEKSSVRAWLVCVPTLAPVHIIHTHEPMLCPTVGCRASTPTSWHNCPMCTFKVPTSDSKHRGAP